MCPGCRALLEDGATVCPYCGWNVEQTEVRRRGGLVERALRPLGGVVPTLLFANVALAVVTAMVSARAVADGRAPGFEGIIDGVLSPRASALTALGACVPERILQRGEWWRMLCPVFLHGGLLHIFMNMSALRNIGGAVEEAWGSGKALAVYLLAGLAGNAATLIWFQYTGSVMVGGQVIPIPRIGASGAIIGYAGVLAALGFRIGGEQGKALWKPMIKAVGFILVLGLVLSMTGSSWQFDNSAHVGGFLFGLAAGRLLSFGVRSRGNPAAVKAWDAAAIVLSLLTAASFVPPALALLKK